MQVLVSSAEINQPDWPVANDLSARPAHAADLEQRYSIALDALVALFPELRRPPLKISH